MVTYKYYVREVKVEMALVLILKIVLLVIVILEVILLVAMAVMIKPNALRDTSYFAQKSYAHRGLHDNEVPENSLWAFRLARENGYGVELDVQMTKDGRLVVFHDGSLKRVCGVDGYLRDYTYEELREFRLNGTDEQIPLFTDVLETLDGMDLICEIKGDNGNKNYEICEKTYNELMTYKGRFCVESFSPFLVEWFRNNHPEIIRGQLSCNFMKDEKMKFFERFSMTHLLVNYVSKPDFVAYDHRDIGMFGFRLCKLLYRPLFVAWTAKGTKEQEKAWKSFDSVIFERLSEEERTKA